MDRSLAELCRVDPVGRLHFVGGELKDVGTRIRRAQPLSLPA
jgi:hypothetical protein